MLQRFSGMLALCAVACGALGCSDPVPPAAAAGLLINLGQCPATSPVATLGKPNPDSRRAADPIGKPIFSGESGTSVSCRVGADGSLYGNIKAPGITFDVTGTVNTTDGIGAGNIGLFAGGITEYVTQPLAATDSPCQLQVIRLTSGLQFEPGAVWAQFTCTNLKPSGVGSTCTAAGEFLLQRCKD